MNEPIKLTQYSHGAGCGCKISPKILDTILHSDIPKANYKNLIVGNESKDDAAVYDIGGGKGIISTTDFFMPIVDDPFTFGKIASANAISDIYAMGGTPMMAIAILGWPINKVPIEAAQQVMEGARAICAEINIPLAGGHSIDAPEPIFGLAVTGTIDLIHLKRNDIAKEGDLLYLTKPLGVGILTTAEKKGILKKEHEGVAASFMMKLNKIGVGLGQIKGINAMTDVTGFGLMGHLREMCEGSGVCATIQFNKVKQIANLEEYILQGSIPGGTHRNWDSYGLFVNLADEIQKAILCDPQTSGGLLIAVKPSARKEVEELLAKEGLADFAEPIGELRLNTGGTLINVE
ncbi:MAG TPA: selenide, water dikinase SelD [Bacteroidia bacterium]|jgi:selenide,water dikinase|nr:selenide, water dikinase SelD [Bacteroidia bacterium]